MNPFEAVSLEGKTYDAKCKTIFCAVRSLCETPPRRCAWHRVRRMI